MQFYIERKCQPPEVLDPIQAALPHIEVRVNPIGPHIHLGEEELETLEPNPILVYGSVQFVQWAYERGIRPGGFYTSLNNVFGWMQNWRHKMLNFDGKPTFLHKVDIKSGEEVFIRPTQDFKVFAGKPFTKAEFEVWFRKDVIGMEGYTRIQPDMEVIIAPVKKIHQELRFFIVNKQIVSYSQYRLNGKLDVAKVRPIEDAELLIEEALAVWTPIETLVIDVARTDDGWKIVEANTLGCAGGYACNMVEVFRRIHETYLTGGTARSAPGD